MSTDGQSLKINLPGSLLMKIVLLTDSLLIFLLSALMACIFVKRVFAQNLMHLLWRRALLPAADKF